MKLASNFFGMAAQCLEMSLLRCMHRSAVMFAPSAKISKPPTSFGLFVKERKVEIMHEKNVVGGNFLKYAAAEWKKLSFPDKQYYADRSQKAMALYYNSLNSLTEFERNQIKEEKNQRQATRIQRKTKKMKASLGRPKQALTGYKIFMKEMFATKRISVQGSSIANTSREVKVRWETVCLLKPKSQLRCIHLSTVMLFAPSTKFPKPPNSFGLFVQEKKDEIMHDKNVVGGNFLKYAAAEWKKVSFPDKQYYADRSQKAMALYYNSLNSLTEFERNQIKEEKNQRQAARIQRKTKKMKASLGRPKQALTGYKIFMKEMFATKRISVQGSSIANTSREVKVRWDSLPFETKEEYDSQARLDKQRYLIEMETYVRKLREEGYEQLVPKKYQKLWLQPKLGTTWKSLIDKEWPTSADK